MTTTQGEHAQTEALDALADSQYLAGAKAGWNAANSDDPNAAFQQLHDSRAGYLKPLHAQPAAPQGVAYAELPTECDSPELCAVSKSCAGQFGTQRICASNGQAPVGTAVGVVRWAAGIEGSQLEVRWKDGEAPPAGTQVYAQTTTAQAAPAAGAVAGPAATVIKRGADREFMSERLGHLPDGIYSLYLAAPTPAAQADSKPAPERSTSPLSEFQDGQWWVQELNKIWGAHARKIAVTDDLKRAVAVVHHLLRAVRETEAAATTPAAQADSVLEDAARLLRQILAASQDGDSDTHLSAHFVSRIETTTKAGGAA